MTISRRFFLTLYRYSDWHVPLCIDVLNPNLSVSWENGTVAGATRKLSTNECDLDKDERGRSDVC